jgi:hypothetical protein
MQAAINTSTRIVEQFGESVGARTECIVADISDATVQALRTALATPNGGATLAEDLQTVTALPVPQATLDAQAAKAAAEAADATDRAQLQTLDDALSTYIANGSPSAAQTVTAVKALCRFARYVIRRGVRQGWL